MRSTADRPRAQHSLIKVDTSNEYTYGYIDIDL